MDFIDQILGGNRGKRYSASKGGYAKVLNLAQYQYLYISMMSLVSTGGGVTSTYNADSFWEDVTTDRPLRLEIPLSNENSLITDVSCITVTNGVPTSAGFSLTATVGTPCKVTVLLAKDSDSHGDYTLIMMEVEQMAVSAE